MNIIVAVNSDWGIGFGGTQSIVIPEDRRHFKELTSGGVVVAGRKTFEDFGKPLLNRKNIILSRDKGFTAYGAVVRHSIDDVLAEAADVPADKVFVIGGESIYRLFLPMCSLAYITKIESAPLSDSFFPNLDELPDWQITEKSEQHEYITGNVSQTSIIYYSFILYRKSI